MLFAWFLVAQKRALSFVLTFLRSSPFLSADYGYELDDDDGFWIQGGSTSGGDTLTFSLLLILTPKHTCNNLHLTTPDVRAYVCKMKRNIVNFTHNRGEEL